MKTTIYKDYGAFLGRSDKDDNGVSQSFADSRPRFESENETNKGCWNCARCARCANCARCDGCIDCVRCAGCARCAGCDGCAVCADCADCDGCADLKNPKPAKSVGKSWLDVPIIKNIHQLVLRAVEKPDALEMKTWHTCDTTHCRGGWIVTLAGEKGKALEAASSTLFAAMQICKASSPIKVSPVRFFETNEVAMADIKRCAEQEAKLETSAK
jgi:hypothetical protein